MCNQAKRLVEGLFSSSKDVSRSKKIQELSSNPGHLLFIAKGYAASRYLDDAVKNVLTGRTGQGDRTRPVTTGQA
jgi:hypothetical protein